MNNTSKKVILIFGPTGVGKSSFVEHLASVLPIEIINMDIGSFYTQLTIGTAKPAWKKSTIPHHLFDIIDQPKDFTVVEYRSAVKEVVDTMWEQNKIPVLVGGSGFYLKSLFFPPRLPTIPDTTVSEPVDKDTSLWEKLKAIDPLRAQQIHPHDTYRIERALHMWNATGKRPSTFKPVYDPLFPKSYIVYLTRDRQDLYNRIDKRVNQMIKQGLVEEAQSLYNQIAWRTFLGRKKIIGYDDLFTFFDSNQTQEEMDKSIKRMQKRTRNYAKRQELFWNMLKKELEAVATNQKEFVIDSVNITHTSLQVVRDRIVKYITSNR